MQLIKTALLSIFFTAAVTNASYAEKECSLNDKTALRYYIDHLAKTPEIAQKAYNDAVTSFETLAKEQEIDVTLMQRDIDIQRSDDSDTPFYTIEAELQYSAASIEDAIGFMTLANSKNMDVSLSQQSKLPRGCRK